MSERRCCPTCGNTPYYDFEEPQEGASATAESFRDVMTPGVSSSGAPSCDSTELAAWRKAVPFMHPDSRPIGEALLRMVDELRAKLAEADALAQRAGKHAVSCQQRAEARMKELEAKIQAEEDAYKGY